MTIFQSQANTFIPVQKEFISKEINITNNVLAGPALILPSRVEKAFNLTQRYMERIGQANWLTTSRADTIK